MLQTLYKPILNLVFPQSCDCCGKAVENFFDGNVCVSCWQETKIFTGDETICSKCGRFLNEKVSNVETFCHQCDEHFYEMARAVGVYEKGLSSSILFLKREPFVSKRLKILFAEAFKNSTFQDSDLIMPVPLSKKRFLERGFNQSLILAEFLAKQTGIKLDDKSLSRIKHSSKHRAGMDKKGRELSVKKSFEVRREKLIRGKKILLVDDVFTSGATTSNCAKALKEKGAEEIYVLTLARVR